MVCALPGIVVQADSSRVLMLPSCYDVRRQVASWDGFPSAMVAAWMWHEEWRVGASAYTRCDSAGHVGDGRGRGEVEVKSQRWLGREGQGVRDRVVCCLLMRLRLRGEWYNEVKQNRDDE